MLRIFAILFLCFSFENSYSFSDTTISLTELKNLEGCWKGSLSYLDYSTGKPFTMPANIQVKIDYQMQAISMDIKYPEEPKANEKDTVLVSKNGALFDGEPVKFKKYLAKDSLQIVTEIESIDGNDNKPATIRHTYEIGRSTYKIKKEVLFQGNNEWILRHMYTLSSVKCN